LADKPRGDFEFDQLSRRRPLRLRRVIISMISTRATMARVSTQNHPRIAKPTLTNVPSAN